MGRVTHYDTVQMMAGLFGRSGGIWATIADKTRSNTLLSSMAIGDVVDVQVSTAFPALRYKLAHVNYTGGYSTVAEFHEDPSRVYNSIWIPDKLPCLAGSTSAYTRQFDAPELEYAVTWNTAFIQDKAYYKLVGATYVQLVAGTDYTVGASIAEWTAINGNVYSKNHSGRVVAGYNSWQESNLRQWLNSTGSGWFAKQNEYDQIVAGWPDGWLTGFDAGLLAFVQRVNNKTAGNSVLETLGGNGSAVYTTLDTFWLPGEKEILNSGSDGLQFDYFKNVADTAAERIQIDEAGTAKNISMRSTHLYVTNINRGINTSGTLLYTNPNVLNALLPTFCIA